MAASTDMNPILLKPKKEMSSQVVVHGKPLGDYEAKAYREQYLPKAEGIVIEALNRLRSEAGIVVLEGAGSPAEVNLKDRDIVNMRLAGWADAPVLLVADIDRGGVFASIVGTLEILEPHERDRIKGFIINKFRGDVSLLKPGLDWLEERTGKPVLGVIPYLHNLGLEDEDSASLDAKLSSRLTEDCPPGVLDIAVPRLPRLSNFTDFDPFLAEPDVHLRYVHSPEDFGTPDAVLLPGSKNTVDDLAFLRESGLAELIVGHVSAGGFLTGICAGYQMLGERLLDPDFIESDQPEVPGLGLFPAETVFTKEKRTVRVAGTAEGWSEGANPLPVEGYEIHMGQTRLLQHVRRPFLIGETAVSPEKRAYHPDGVLSEDGRVWGTYIHGIFQQDAFRRQWLNQLRAKKGLPPLPPVTAYGAGREEAFDRLADHVRKHLDMHRIYEMIHP